MLELDQVLKTLLKLSIHIAADVFLSISSVSLSVYGAVAALCEEFESHQDRSGEPEILMGQSIVLGKVKAEVPSQNKDSMNDQIFSTFNKLNHQKTK